MTPFSRMKEAAPARRPSTITGLIVSRFGPPEAFTTAISESAFIALNTCTVASSSAKGMIIGTTEGMSSVAT